VPWLSEYATVHNGALDENVDFLRRKRPVMPHTLWVIKTTLPKSWLEAEVGSFAQSLLESGAACIHHHLITSTYTWEDKIQSEQEWAVEIKVSKANKNEVLEKLENTHPYDVPQIIVQECVSSDSYGEWVDSQ
jgi:periplasmic divalent cation tolerance protein